jgi:hypothetical protein
MWLLESNKESLYQVIVIVWLCEQIRTCRPSKYRKQQELIILLSCGPKNVHAYWTGQFWGCAVCSCMGQNVKSYKHVVFKLWPAEYAVEANRLKFFQCLCSTIKSKTCRWVVWSMLSISINLVRTLLQFWVHAAIEIWILHLSLQRNAVRVPFP